MSSALVDSVAGWSGGLAGLAVGHPFDTVKVRLQHNRTGSLYRSSYNAFRSIVHNENFSGIFKGISSPALGVAFMNASIFATYGLFLRMFARENNANPSLASISLAGAACGVGTAWITTPIEHIKILQQANTHKNPSALTIARLLIRKYGFFNGFYRGFSITCIRDLGFGPYFAVYEALGRALEQYNSAAVSIIAGGAAGVVAWAATFPVDVIKTRYQSLYSDVLSRSQARDQGNVHTRTIIKHIYATHGWRGFFAGFGPTMLRAVPVNAATFAVYEMTLEALG